MNLGAAIDIARTMRRHGMPVDEVLANSAIPVEFRAEVRAALLPTVLVDPSVALADAGRDWIARLKPEDWYYWSRLRGYLLGKKEWDVATVDSIDEWSLRVLGRLPDPRSAEFLSRGLVVGYVQSGKTANFTAVAARAVDAGYRLIIVLSGIHNELRRQTQDRLDQELTGNAPNDVLSVERPDEDDRLWGALTTSEDDFQGPLDHARLQGKAPILAVVKKHCGILSALLAGLETAPPGILARLPTLIIDDEADQASVNTGGDRPPADQDIDADEFEAVDPETAPSRTNALIRQLLDFLPARAYVGYTATPFANVLTNPGAIDRDAGEGLYPSDFILQLPRPAGYCGAEELFGVNGGTGRNAVRSIPQAEADELRPKRGRLSSFRASIPARLGLAIEDFLLAGATRLNRKQVLAPNTMLVHTSHYMAAQNPLAARIREHVQGLKADWSFGDAGGLRARLRGRWETDFAPNLDDRKKGTPVPDFDVIAQHVTEVLSRVEVRTLNSESGEELNYENAKKEKRQLQVIAVGGNRLSRGLTLEGLTVSYYLRTTNMCDTLLQMARWFGYRHGYEDLLRLYLTDELARWFAELALMEGDLRDEIYRLNESGENPVRMGIRIRSHSSMMVTSRLKMKYGTTIRVGYSGQHPQTIVFPLTNAPELDRNVEAADRLLANGTPAPSAGGGVLLEQVSPMAILSFLRSYRFAAETRSMDPTHLCRWIESRVAAGDLLDWRIYVDSRQDGELGRIQLGQAHVGLVGRSRLPGTMSIGTLLDPKHEGIDLPGGSDAHRKARSYDAVAMRRARPRDQGLLVLYAISSESVPGDSAENRVPLFEAGWTRPRAVIGFGLSLPFTDDDGATEYVVGRRWSEDAR